MQPVSPIFGKLTTASIPWDQPLIMTASLIVVLGSFSVFALITYLRRWGWLWREWLTTTDHKKIGIMYTMLSLVMLLRGFSDVILMRSQQAIAAGGNQGFLASEHYNQVFTAHGTIMIFFMAMPFITGLMNFAVPLQIGARDVAFPMVNGIAFWLTATGALLVNISLGIGEFARTGWIAYPPLSELAYSPGVGVDYYLVALSISGIGTLIGAVNLVTTILKMRAPGMTMMRLPIFTWTALATNILIVAAFPILTATFGMLLLDRYVGMHFFTNDAGGNPMMYINLIWMWGHPEVYILILPAFGVFSEVISTFSGKPLFGYRSMVLATMSIAFFAFTTWGHHFYTMGSGADVNGFFSITTMIIAVPTGVKVFNWLFTMYRGRIRFEVPMLWAMGFIVTFVIGGMTGVLLAEAPVDFELHNSVFLVAHFHNVIIGGVFFGVMAGYNYWFPKAFGFTLDARLGKIAFWCWFIGFYTAFLPLYQLGLMGMTRRLAHYDHPEWQPYLIVALIGALIVFCGILAIIAQLYVSIRTHRRRVAGADPWDGRTLEWSIASPPPAYNFAVLPEVSDVDAYWGMKQAGRQAQQQEYTPFDVPKPSWCGFMISFFAVPGGFAVIWHIWWLAAGAVLAILAVLLWNCWGEDDDEVELTTDEIARTEAAHPLVPA